MTADTGSQTHMNTSVREDSPRSTQRVFVPWALSRVVGEWHFLESPIPEVVVDESINMNHMWLKRSMFQDIPRHNLHCDGISSAHYQSGPLESWTKGTLRLDGSHHCHITHRNMGMPVNWRDSRSKQTGQFRAYDRDTLDIDKESFLIEAVLRVDSNTGSSGILGKYNNAGYELHLDERGTPLISLGNGSTKRNFSAASSIADGQWHHLMVEVNRDSSPTITFFLDGKQNIVHEYTKLTNNDSLSNNGDFKIGRTSSGYLRGDIDFVRLSKGTLADAETNIKELYHWQFGQHSAN